MNTDIVVLDVETLRLSTDPGMSWGDIPALGLACAVTWSEADGFREWVGDAPGAPAALAKLKRADVEHAADAMAAFLAARGDQVVLMAARAGA